jgi:hypothetical protein
LASNLFKRHFFDLRLAQVWDCELWHLWHLQHTNHEVNVDCEGGPVDADELNAEIEGEVDLWPVELKWKTWQAWQLNTNSRKQCFNGEIDWFHHPIEQRSQTIKDVIDAESEWRADKFPNC